MILALGVLAVLALVRFAWPVYRASLPLQIDVNEAWNAYHVDMLRIGTPLYSFDDFVTNNYPPLSFHVVDLISRLTGLDVLSVGRALSLAAVVIIALAVFASIRNFGASRLAATLGALWWFASMATFYDSYVGMDDPHLVALAIMTCALALALRDPKSDRCVAPAIVLMALAGFYKHNLVALPLAVLIWLGVQDWRRGIRLAVLGIGAAALGLAVCRAVYGGAFLHSLLFPRHYDIGRLASVGRLQFIAPALVIAAAWAAYRRRAPAAQFAAIFMAVGVVSHLGQVVADGVADNAMFELVVAVAIGIGIAFDDLTAIRAVRRRGLERSRFVVVLILIGRLLLTSRLSPYLILVSPEFRAGLDDRVAVAWREIARVSAIPGPVVCPGVPLICRFAGKPFVFDGFVVREYVLTGLLSEQDVSRRIADRKLRFEAVDPRTDIGDL